VRLEGVGIGVVLDFVQVVWFAVVIKVVATIAEEEALVNNGWGGRSSRKMLRLSECTGDQHTLYLSRQCRSCDGSGYVSSGERRGGECCGISIDFFNFVRRASRSVDILVKIGKASGRCSVRRCKSFVERGMELFVLRQQDVVEPTDALSVCRGTSGRRVLVVDVRMSDFGGRHRRRTLFFRTEE
jgi:hypothetical protein